MVCEGRAEDSVRGTCPAGQTLLPLISIPLHISSVHQFLPSAIENGDLDSVVRKRMDSTAGGEFQLLVPAFCCDIRSEDSMMANG